MKFNKNSDKLLFEFNLSYTIIVIKPELFKSYKKLKYIHKTIQKCSSSHAAFVHMKNVNL